MLLCAITSQRYPFQAGWIGEAEPGSEAVAALDHLQPVVGISDRKGSKFMNIRTSGEDATFVAKLANAVARADIDEIDAGRGELNEEATEFLIKAADRLRTRPKEVEVSGSGLILNRFHAFSLGGPYSSSRYYNGYYGEVHATHSLAHGKRKA